MPEKSTPAASLRLRSRLWVVLLPLLLILQLFFPSKAWMALLVGMGGAWLLAYLWARSLKDHLRLQREMRYGWAHVGDRLEERFTLINTGPIPALWVEIADSSTLPDYAVSQVRAIGADSRETWTSRHFCSQRGLFTLGPARLRTTDPLGLYEVNVDVPDSTVLMVTPPVVPLPEIEIAPGGRAGEGRRLRRDPLERTVTASGVNAYHPGDPLHWIHWPTSIRKQELYVHNFDSTPTSDWWIFLDLQQEVQFGEGWNSTLEHGIILAASLVDRGLSRGQSVGLSASGEPLLWLPPNSAAGQRLQILRALALAGPGHDPLGQLLETARPALQHGASLILITPDLSGAWLEAIFFLVRSRLVPTVLLFDPASYGANGSLGPLRASLTHLGISPFIVTREMLDRPEARPGHAGEWEWHVTGFGRAIPVRKPEDLSWHKVGG
jgi:uncharacterized protein (DUF58 family)